MKNKYDNDNIEDISDKSVKDVIAAASNILVFADNTEKSLREKLERRGFDEAVITCRTTLGELIIEGSSLHIRSFSAEKGELSVDGKISALYYDEGRERGGLRRLFRK